MKLKEKRFQLRRNERIRRLSLNAQSAQLINLITYSYNF